MQQQTLPVSGVERRQHQRHTVEHYAKVNDVGRIEDGIDAILVIDRLLG